MTTRRCIFAYTADGALYPPFLSINREEDGRLTITVRGPRREPGTPDNPMSFVLAGREATITLPDDQALALENALHSEGLRRINEQMLDHIGEQINVSRPRPQGA